MRLLLALLALFIATPALALDRYRIDPEHTSILFFVDHFGFSQMVGRFTQFDGGFRFDPKQPEAASVTITLKPAGIRTSSPALDSELQGEHFFNSAQYPTIAFTSTALTPGEGQTGELTGTITLLGVTRPITLHVRFNKADYHPLTQDFVAGFSAEGTIKRSDFGMTYLIPMVGDDIHLLIQAEGINLDRKAAERITHR